MRSPPESTTEILESYWRWDNPALSRTGVPLNPHYHLRCGRNAQVFNTHLVGFFKTQLVEESAAVLSAR
jgi:hypothetical protein